MHVLLTRAHGSTEHKDLYMLLQARDGSSSQVTCGDPILLAGRLLRGDNLAGDVGLGHLCFRPGILDAFLVQLQGTVLVAPTEVWSHDVMCAMSMHHILYYIHTGLDGGVI